MQCPGEGSGSEGVCVCVCRKWSVVAEENHRLGVFATAHCTESRFELRHPAASRPNAALGLCSEADLKEDKEEVRQRKRGRGGGREVGAGYCGECM